LFGLVKGTPEELRTYPLDGDMWRARGSSFGSFFIG
jgi:hypothetical protein